MMKYANFVIKKILNNKNKYNKNSLLRIDMLEDEFLSLNM